MRLQPDPPVMHTRVFILHSLEVLVLVDNNISELPPFLSQLTLLHTLWLVFTLILTRNGTSHTVFSYLAYVV